jgi:hypothetical protein
MKQLLKQLHHLIVTEIKAKRVVAKKIKRIKRVPAMVLVPEAMIKMVMISNPTVIRNLMVVTVKRIKRIKRALAMVKPKNLTTKKIWVLIKWIKIIIKIPRIRRVLTTVLVLEAMIKMIVVIRNLVVVMVKRRIKRIKRALAMVLVLEAMIKMIVVIRNQTVVMVKRIKRIKRVLAMVKPKNLIMVKRI